MEYAAGTAIMIISASLSFSAASARAASNVVQQSTVSVNRESSSVTISGQTVTVDTSTDASRVVGNGQRASEARSIGAVSAINADGAFMVTVKVGAPPGLTIETDKNLLPIVKTDVSNGRIDIYTDRSYSVDGRIDVTVTSPNVAEISASGSNHIDGEGLTGANLSISLNGANNAALAGNVSAVTVRMSGANHLSAQQLVADSANVTVNGSGNATVDARQRLVAEVSGAGSITVYGNPKQRRAQANGAGRIRFVR
jgi:Putative auto-transporter adhesin, head GIN domain